MNFQQFAIAINERARGGPIGQRMRLAPLERRVIREALGLDKGKIAVTASSFVLTGSPDFPVWAGLTLRGLAFAEPVSSSSARFYPSTDAAEAAMKLDDYLGRDAEVLLWGTDLKLSRKS